MLALVLVAALSAQQIMGKFDDFCVKAEIDIPHPLCERMVTKRLTHSNSDFMEIWVEGKYTLTYLRGRVKAFQNIEEKPFVKLTRLDPNEMKHWSEQPCLLDEGTALQIAKRIFVRLGFDEDHFDLVEVHRYSWQPSYTDPKRVLWLPLFLVRWYQKGYSRDRAVPASVRMDISGTTKSMVYFLDATERGRQEFLSHEQPTRASQSEGEGYELSRSEIVVCEEFLETIGVATVGTNETPRAGRYQGFPTLAANHWVSFHGRFSFCMKGEIICSLRDDAEDPAWLKLSENYAGLRKLADQATVLSADQAQKLASNYLEKLGFHLAKFDPPLVEPESRTFEDPDQPGKSRSLPVSYFFEYFGKRPFWCRGGAPAWVGVRISGVNGHLVSYQYTPSTLRVW